MARSRCEAAWAHTANLLAMLANCHRDPKKSRPFTPSQFNPFAERVGNEEGIIPADITALKTESMRVVSVDAGSVVVVKKESHGSQCD